MEVKLCGFLIFCHLVFATGNLRVNPKPSKNRIWSKFPRNTTQANKPLSTVEPTTSHKAYDVVTEPNTARQCPEGQSSISETDLNEMIRFFVEANNLIETINGSYFELATSVRDKHLKAVNDFLTRFQNRSTHLGHILDDMVQTRKDQIEPLVKEIIYKIPEISSLQNNYAEHINFSKIQLEKFEKSKKICALNCDATEFRSKRERSTSETISSPKSTSSSSSEEIYYCSSLKDVKNKINVALSQFKNDHIETLLDTLSKVDRNYDLEIEILKSKMKEAAVQEFSITMYDVLSLEDDYYHFLNSLKNEYGINQFQSDINKVKKNIMQITLKTEELKNDVEKYRKYCLSCDKKDRYIFDTTNVIRQQQYRRREPTNDALSTKPTNDVLPTRPTYLPTEPTDDVSPTDPTEDASTTEPTDDMSLTDPTDDVSPTEPTDNVSPTEPTNDVLEKLLDGYIETMKSQFQTDLDNLFKIINVVLTDKDGIIQQALIYLHPVQNKIMNDLKAEEQKLNALKNQVVPESLLDYLDKINEDLTNLQKKLEEALKLIQHTIKI